ncbi:hypothetical protein [Occallatibacter savannae]|uniref:hypothetical protein n=1 Tax=Occallatibacter savannae TaxID=1002691 RepID=UPI000D69909F|nr:hypothetical protein [Occallatibacter savannae]
MSLRSWFEKKFAHEHEIQARAERREVPGLEAIHWTGSSPGLDIVKNISSTGMYLVTRERWPEGEINPVRLVYPELTDDSAEKQVTIETRTVRWGEDGMGLSFVLPECMDLWLWQAGERVEPADILSEFRLSRALAFLRRICPAATQELNLLFREGLGNMRVPNAIAIAHRAEIMLAAEANFHQMHAPASVVLRVVKEGSWAEDTATQNLWAGILATACTIAGDDESNLPYMDLLAEMATVDTRLYVEACSKAPKVFATNGAVSASPLMCTADEMIHLTGTKDLSKIDRNILQLSILGLLEPREKAKYFSFAQTANLTPTALGLELYARCQGHRGAPFEFYSSQKTKSPEPSEQKGPAGDLPA